MAESDAVTLPDADATQRLGSRLARALQAGEAAGLTIYLEGDLGAGKTTLARGFLAAMGHGGRVPSPTYTLIEPYSIGRFPVYHIDLYRIRDPLELDDLGLAELLSGSAVALIEWPDHGAGRLPAPDVVVRLQVDPGGRLASWEARTSRGRELLARMA